MRSTILMLCLLLPAVGFGQSLAEVAKKEKERREKNKGDGREVLVIHEDALVTESEASSEGEESSAETGAPRRPPARPRTTTGPRGPGQEGDEELSSREDELEDDEAFVPAGIPADAPLDDRLKAFQLMKQDYQRQVRQIDKSISENDERIRQLDAKIGGASALGGGGLPVAPQTGTGAATAPMTGQDTNRLVGEQNQLKALNDSLRKQKEQLKTDLQGKGRAAGIPPGYLRF